MAAKLQIEWFGHACFLISSASGVKILTDPFDESVGYPLPDVSCDIVTSSHDHFDHNNVSVARGPVVLKGQENTKMKRSRSLLLRHGMMKRTAGSAARTRYSSLKSMV